ncbi:porin [Chitinimonas sp.]|uniref:porin n=1 Tax=Chitinimonas sp. TaxID=1934313 RepID=UPI0035AE189A
MNKKLIALAIAAIAPAAFAAGNEVVLYGQVNVGVVAADHWDVFTYGPNSVSQVRVDDLNTNSRFGIKGEEDLGGGLKAFFKVEQGIGPDATVANVGVQGSSNGNAFASREGWVGVKGGFGSIGLGRGKSAYQVATENFDLFDGNITLDINAGDIAYNFGAAKNTKGELVMVPAGDKVDAFGGAASYRFSNDIKYTYEANGLSIALDYGLGTKFQEDKDAKTGKSGRNFAASVQYNFEPFWVISAYNNQKAVNDNKTDNFLIGGGWGAGPLNVGVAYEYNRATYASGVNNKQNLVLINTSYDVGASTFKVGLIHGDKVKSNGNTVKDSDFDRYALGWRYGLSKRTATVVEYGHIDYKSSFKDATTFTVGLMHSF